jgi:hypothetical protein
LPSFVIFVICKRQQIMDVECNDIASLNSAFESGAELPATVWDRWLWKCDLAEPVSVDCMLNRMHLLGLLISRYRASRESSLADICLSLPGIVNHQSNVAKLTPRQLKDVVDCLQMHWPQYVTTVPTEVLIETVDACMVHFGGMNLRPCVYEDVNMRDPLCEHRMSQPTIRRFVSIFCVLYRHLHMDHFAVAPSKFAEYEPIQDCHLQASQETFYRLVMHSDLPPAARLLYRQDFAGFYHCVSQVVYFHYPSYERPDQLSLLELREGGPPVFTLAPVCEMYPEINVCFEDDPLKENSWNWFLMGRRVFLVRPNGSVLGSSNLLVLLGAFVAETAER